MTESDILKRLAAQLRREAISRRRVNIGLVPGPNTALYLSEELNELLLRSVYGDSWAEDIRAEVSPEPGFEDFEEY